MHFYEPVQELTVNHCPVGLTVAAKSNEFHNCFEGPISCLCTGALSTLATPLSRIDSGLRLLERNPTHRQPLIRMKALNDDDEEAVSQEGS